MTNIEYLQSQTSKFILLVYKQGFTVVLLIVIGVFLTVNTYRMYNSRDKYFTKRDSILSQKVDSLQWVFMKCAVEKTMLYEDQLKARAEIEVAKDKISDLQIEVSVLKDIVTKRRQ